MEFIEMAHILSGGHEGAVQDITELVSDYDTFYSKHADWCDEMLEGVKKRHDQLLVAFAYWLTGCDTDRKFGGYIDWKEATEDILWNLEPAIQALGSRLNLKDISFTGEEFTDEALQVINAYFGMHGYTLANLETGGGCYHLFVVPVGQCERLVQLSEAVNFRFFDQFE